MRFLLLKLYFYGLNCNGILYTIFIIYTFDYVYGDSRTHAACNLTLTRMN